MSGLWCTLDFWPGTPLLPAEALQAREIVPGSRRWKCRFQDKGQTPMKYFLRAFTPTKNRRLNELIGFLLLVSATLLFLALASYSPLDPSLNTAGSQAGGARNWIGLFGAVLSDLLLQSAGIFAFVFPVMLGLLGLRWFKSLRVAS